MSDFQFEQDQFGSFGIKRPVEVAPKIPVYIQFLLKLKIAQDEKQAQLIVLGVALVLIIISAVVFIAAQRDPVIKTVPTYIPDHS